MTHGITSISAEIIVDATLIRFQDEAKIKISKLSSLLDKLDTGFFNLYLYSSLHMSKQSEVRDLTATK